MAQQLVKVCGMYKICCDAHMMSFYSLQAAHGVNPVSHSGQRGIQDRLERDAGGGLVWSQGYRRSGTGPRGGTDQRII